MLDVVYNLLVLIEWIRLTLNDNIGMEAVFL